MDLRTIRVFHSVFINRKSNNWKIKYFQSFKMFRNKSSNTTHYITKTDKQLFQQLHCQIGNVQSYTNANRQYFDG